MRKSVDRQGAERPIRAAQTRWWVDECNHLARTWLKMPFHLLLMVVSSSGSDSKSSAHRKDDSNPISTCSSRVCTEVERKESDRGTHPAAGKCSYETRWRFTTKAFSKCGECTTCICYFITSLLGQIPPSQLETPTTNGGTPPRSRAQCISTNLSSHLTFPPYPPRNTTFLHSFFHAP